MLPGIAEASNAADAVQVAFTVVERYEAATRLTQTAYDNLKTTPHWECAVFALLDAHDVLLAAATEVDHAALALGNHPDIDGPGRHRDFEPWVDRFADLLAQAVRTSADEGRRDLVWDLMLNGRVVKPAVEELVKRQRERLAEVRGLVGGVVAELGGGR